MKPIKAWAVIREKGEFKDVYWTKSSAEQWVESDNDKVIRVIIKQLPRKRKRYEIKYKSK